MSALDVTGFVVAVAALIGVGLLYRGYVRETARIARIAYGPGHDDPDDDGADPIDPADVAATDELVERLAAGEHPQDDAAVRGLAGFRDEVTGARIYVLIHRATGATVTVALPQVAPAVYRWLPDDPPAAAHRAVEELVMALIATDVSRAHTAAVALGVAVTTAPPSSGR